MKEILLKNLKKRLYILILPLSILSILFINYTYLSLSISLISLTLSILFLKKHKKLLIVTIIICLSTILTNYLNIKKAIDDKKDVFKDKNILLGSYIYNEYDGKYVFKEDSYIQYSNSDTTDNYCVGKYEYTYGGTSNEGIIIRQDANYYYYDLKLKEDYCIIMGIENYDKYEKKFIVAIDKFNNDNIIFINNEKKLITLEKIQE